MSKLFEIQKWFGALISAPLQTDHKIAKTTPFGTDIQEEARKYIAPSPTLQPHQRLELYHQQYWWRLLNSLQENFPSLTRLYGYEAFNEHIGIPYLHKNPPNHWALSHLGQSLPNWLKKDLDRDLAAIDAAVQRAFWAEIREPFNFQSDDVLDQRITLQPHIHLFKLGGDLFSFRDVLLKEAVSYWQNHSFPKIRDRTCFFALYRNPNNQVRWKELSVGEHHLLSLFKNKISIQEACTKVEKKGGEIYKEAQELLPLWFCEWTFLKWF